MATQSQPAAPRATKGRLLLVGDSHAMHFTTLATNVAERFSLEPIVISEAAIPFPVSRISTLTGGLSFEKSSSGAADLSRKMEAALSAINPDETNLLILSSFYRLYFEAPLGVRKYQIMTHYDSTGRTIPTEEALQNWLEDLRTFADRHQNLKIFIFLSTPEMPDIYAWPLCVKEWFRPYLSDKCSVQVIRQDMAEILANLNSRIISAVASSPNVYIFDPMPAVCPEGQTVCSSQDGEERLFFDEDHLSEIGSFRVEAAFADYLERNGFTR